ncbi:uncharacterized protein METZ01_LOCUS482530, partial [marine metagenome]
QRPRLQHIQGKPLRRGGRLGKSSARICGNAVRNGYFL